MKKAGDNINFKIVVILNLKTQNNLLLVIQHIITELFLNFLSTDVSFFPWTSTMHEIQVPRSELYLVDC